MKIVLSNEALRTRAFEVDMSTKEGKETAHRIINEVKDELNKHGDLPGACAPQIGEDARIVCLKFSNGDVRTLINPVITFSEGTKMSREKTWLRGDREYIIPRSETIQVIYQTPTGKTEENAFTGFASCVLQNMIDLINGVLLDDVGLEILEGFVDLGEEDKKVILAMYLKSLENRNRIASEMVKSDKVMHAIDGAINFSQNYLAGNIDTIPLTDEEMESIRKKRVN